MQGRKRRVWVGDTRKTRLFLAVPVPVSWRPRLLGYQQLLKATAVTGTVPVRWTPPDNFHSTVRFIGSISKDRIPGLCAELAAISTALVPFTLPFLRAGFVSVKQPKMIWITFRTTPAFRRTFSVCTRTVAAYLRKECGGMTLHNGHRLIPHITIARLKGEAQHIRLPAYPGKCPSLPVRSLTLFSSETRPEGSVYRHVATFRLRPKPGTMNTPG